MMQNWSPLPEVSPAAVQIAIEIAGRFRDEARLLQATRVINQQTAYPTERRWIPLSTAEGHAGVAVLFAQLNTCFPGAGWDQVGHRHLALASQAVQKASSPPLGLLSGLSGIAFATWLLSRGGSRYQRAQRAIDASLFPQARALAEFISQQTAGVPVTAYDVVSGLTGVGAYLLCRAHEEEAAALLQQILKSLLHLTDEKNGLPYWYTPPAFAPPDVWRATFPSGYFNCGFAHGVPGVLAFLALARLHGVSTEGLEEGIDRVANWIIAHQLEDQWGINWPTLVSVNPAEQGPQTLTPTQSAWCYGSPGIARSLWLAGEAIHHVPYREIALKSMRGVYQRPHAGRAIESPSFCHGIAGQLHITLRFAQETGLKVFQEAAKLLLEQLLALYDPASLLGYRSKETRGARVDSPGLLDGAAGVVLVLLAVGTAQEPLWDRLLVLS